MKKWLSLLCLLLILPVTGLAEDTVSYEGLISFTKGAEEIDFGEVRITDWEALPAFLRLFPNLKKADMYASPITYWKADALHEAFPNVKFGWTLRITSYDHHQHLVRTDATAFSTLHGSKSTEHTDAEIGALRYCTELRALDFGHNGVSDLSFLYELPELRVLIIAINHVSDLTPIASLKHLQYLEVFRNQITDLSPLSGLSELKDLNIGYNMITDASPLYSLTGLERLWVDHAAYYNYSETGPDLSEEQIRKLREALPNTEINDNSLHPTGGGWRKHPRYDIVFQTFKHGVYIPFDDTPFSDEPARSTPTAPPAPTASPASTALPQNETPHSTDSGQSQGFIFR